jgi:O-antigen/teichoic acid export membrane protein
MSTGFRPFSLRALVDDLPPQAVATFAIRITAIGAEFIAILLLARLLGAASYGQYAFAMSVVAIAAVPAMLGFDRLLIREMATMQAASAWGTIKGLLTRAAQATALASLAIVCLLTLAAALSGTGDPGMRLALAFAAALVPVTAFLRVQQAALQGLGHVAAGLTAESLVQPLALVALVLALVVAGPLRAESVTALTLQVCASGAALVTASLLLRRRLPALVAAATAHFRGGEWLASSTVFMWLVGMSAALVNVDTLLVGVLLGPSEAGAYRVASQFAMFVGFPLAAVSIAAAPAIAALHSQRRHAELDRRLRGAARVIFAVAAAIAVVAALAGRPLLEALGPGFGHAYPAMLILVAAYLFHAAMAASTYLLFMTAHERLAAALFTAGAASHVGLGLLLIPRFGLSGAAVAAGASLALVSAASALLAWKRTGINATIFSRAMRPERP